MFKRFQDFCESVIPHLDEAFKRELSLLFKDVAVSDYASLSATLEGGKMIRGCLLCMVSTTLGGNLGSAIPRAVAVELIHGATLIHDDFVDQDRVRRSRPAAWTLEGARRAVLLGDIIFATAIKRMNDLSREDGLVVSHAIAQVSKGAFQEPLEPMDLAREIQSGKVDGSLYEKIIHLKTGILFGAACQMGAIAARADDDLRERWYRYGSFIGEAYQIADDLKEVQHHLSTRSIHSKQMAFLAPAFLYFIKEARPSVLPALETEYSHVQGLLRESFQEALSFMEKEIERRLNSAVSEIEEIFPGNKYGELVRRAPWDLIKMFSQT
ncbi:MAG: polyprenyl synthetase family protein [Desulfobacteraceae bacterium]